MDLLFKCFPFGHTLNGRLEINDSLSICRRKKTSVWQLTDSAKFHSTYGKRVLNNRKGFSSSLIKYLNSGVFLFGYCHLLIVNEANSLDATDLPYRRTGFILQPLHSPLISGTFVVLGCRENPRINRFHSFLRICKILRLFRIVSSSSLKRHLEG